MKKAFAGRLLATATVIATVGAPAFAQAPESGVATSDQPPTSSSAPAAEAGAAGSGASEEILVTARRTTERLQDVPVAVTAFSGASLQARGIDTLDQVAKYTPNIRFDGAAQLSGGNYNATVFIRGVGSNDFAIFSDPGVGFYVDDVYYARSIGGVMDAIDIENVQVLRGPQGTLFGKNTIGGAVLITTAQPRLGEVSGRVEATYGTFDRIDAKGVVNLPIGDVAALRVSAATLNRDGYVKRLFDGSDQGNRNADMVRAKLRFQPGGALTIDLSGDYTRAREHSAPSDLVAVAPVAGLATPPNFAGAAFTDIPFLYGVPGAGGGYNRQIAPSRGIVAPNGERTINPSWVTASPFETWAGGPNRNDLDLWGLQGTVAYDLGGATLKSISAYRDMKAYFTRDGDNTPFTYRETANRDKQWQFSQEVQLAGKALDDRLSFVVGGFYFKEKASDIARADIAPGVTLPASPASLPSNFVNNKSLAAYGQVDFELFDKLTVELGGRYTNDKKRFRTSVVRQSDNVTYIQADREATFSKFTPRVGVNYKVSPDVLLYASYSQGFKQGGFNGRPLVSAAEVTRYDPETLDTIEAGIKAEWLDRKLTTNVAVFHSTYKDIQLTVNQTPQNFVANAAKGKIDGFEVELVARPVPWFSANASVGHVNARYTEVGQGLGPSQILPINLATDFVKAPKWTATAGFELSHEFDGGSRLSFRGDVSLYSRIEHEVSNFPLVSDDGYELLNARLSYRMADRGLTVSVFGTNLTDTLYIVSGNYSAGFGLAEAAYGRPREWGVSVAYQF